MPSMRDAITQFEEILPLTPREYCYALAMGKKNITIPSEAPLRDHHYSFLDNITTPIEWDKKNTVNPSSG